jgi:hypothetical protein
MNAAASAPAARISAAATVTGSVSVAETSKASLRAIGVDEATTPTG